MALISKIRQNSWILVVLIALGLIGFIVMDMTSGQQSLFGSSQTIMGKIDSKKIDWNEFNRAENILYGNSSADVYDRRDFLWNYFVEEAIVQEEAEELGLGVSKTELIDLQFGANPSPVIQQRFADPTTGMLNRQQLNQFKQAIETNTLTEPTIRAFWAYQEKEIIKDRLQSKINNIVAKALYTPTWLAEMNNVEQNERMVLAYAKVPFDEIDNTEISLEDADFKAFLEENESRYRQEEETRKVEYLAFEVMPTAEDSANWRNSIANLVPQFETAENDSLFVEQNYGLFDEAYVKKEQLSPVIADTVMAMATGSVFGPYQDGNAFNAVKLLDRKIIPDSVRSRHILIRANAANTMEYIQAQQVVDSLKNLIETGQQTFDSLATKFGSDATRDKGGDLGYASLNQMVKPFNDLIFFKAEEGKLYSVITEFGVHLVEVTGRKFLNNTEAVKVAYLSQSIVPSEATQNEYYDKAFAIIGTNKTLEQLQAVAEAEGLALQTSPPLKENDFLVGELGGGQPSRDMVRWAFSASAGQVSPEVYIYQDPVEFFNNRYVVAALKDIQRPGLPSVEYIRSEIEPLVINEKKGEKLKERLSGQKNLEAAASSFSIPVDTAQNVNFVSSFVPGLGTEPAVIARSYKLEPGQVSDPIVGSSGVFLVKLLSKTEAPQANIQFIRQTMAGGTRALVGSQLIQAMKKKASIQDNRSRFY